MEKVIFTRSTLEYFDNLVHTLFRQDYFSFKENAQNYVDKIVDFVTTKIDSFPHKITPENLRFLGTYYIFYKPNKRTTWYVFFEKKQQHYLVTTIMNNYCKEIASLSEG
ncbi:hypothetical protein [Salegentibacter salegens]|uniref:Plasmid stabilization system protein ParE n=1 Tax=Salegentibacter salegens TaxID=143223 RepID=A0A1M7MZU6_9FLAO|nr:hypothetical protein [Salegentibacter salegens]PRX52412.1 hypothetical protein LY58_00051 [Salegentibacter salegens]SHM96608.1 hypothetical protein SAMN05878281_2782 [Salegentibacter salegens]